MISFASPAREHAALREPIEAAVLEVLRSGSYVLGEPVARFEAVLAQATGAAHAIAVSSGTDALACALHALGVGQGHEVIVPAFGFVSAPEAVLRVGARPVFVDIEPATLGPDPSAVAEKLGARTAAVIVMHLFGQAVDLAPLRAACGPLPIVEDAAQAMGTLWDGRQVGTLAEIGTLSFFPAKSLGAAGDGGGVLTNDAAVADRVRAARSHGAPRAYEWTQPGGNYRLDAVQAAVLRVKLEAFGARIGRRRAIGRRLAAAAASHDVETLVGSERCSPTFAPFAMRVKRRDAVAARLRESGIDVRVQYPQTLPACGAFSEPDAMGKRSLPVSFPVAERATQDLLSIPCHAELTDDEVAAIESALHEVLSHV